MAWIESYINIEHCLSLKDILTFIGLEYEDASDITLYKIILICLN